MSRFGGDGNRECGRAIAIAHGHGHEPILGSSGSKVCHIITILFA